jgi:transposase
MLNWNLFEFRQKLRHKALEFGAVVHEVSEHYTSKTCGKCGRIHCALGVDQRSLFVHIAILALTETLMVQETLC